MARFNRPGLAPAPLVTPVQTEQTSTVRTAQGGAGYVRNAESELFLLGATNLVGQKTFYEKATDRDDRYVALVHQLAAEPEGVAWLAGFLPWLRGVGNLRTAPLVAAVELAAAHRGKPDEDHLVRNTIAAVLQRADEPGEALGYWDLAYGGTPPRTLKAGVAMAVARLYTERAVLQYDTDGKAWRFGRVLDVCHPTRDDIAVQVLRTAEINGTQDQAYKIRQRADLFGHLGRRMRKRPSELPESLAMLRAHAELTAVPAADRDALLRAPDAAARFKAAGMGWQAAASWYGKELNSAFWEAMIPNMRLQALAMNLRNFDKVGISDESIDYVCAQLTDSEKVRKSRMLPMQFLSAYRAAGASLNWGRALSRALDHSLAGVPNFGGNTLILVDTSTSMDDKLSEHSDLKRWDAAVVFAAALARRCFESTVVSFSSSRYYSNEARGANTKVFPARTGEALVSAVERWKSDGYFLGGGTDTAMALQKHWRAGYDRVVVLTDEQAGESPVEISQSIPDKVLMVTMNLAGYQYGSAPAGTRHRVTIGGLNDAAFSVLAALDKRAKAQWPWEIVPGAAAV